MICESPIELWNSFSEVSGICENDFFKYCGGVEEDFAIKIDNLHVFDEFIDVDDYEDSRVLQSFYHVENNELLGKLLF